MKLTRISEWHDFINAIEECKGQVWLESPYGDRYMLKSMFSRFVALGTLLDQHGDELKLFCQLPEDEQLFNKYFDKHPGVN